jgi:hypothetical protein
MGNREWGTRGPRSRRKWGLGGMGKKTVTCSLITVQRGFVTAKSGNLQMVSKEFYECNTEQPTALGTGSR